jgi:hypothetical protein
MIITFIAVRPILATVGITRTRFPLSGRRSGHPPGTGWRPGRRRSELPDADFGIPAYMSRIGCTQCLNPLLSDSSCKNPDRRVISEVAWDVTSIVNVLA